MQTYIETTEVLKSFFSDAIDMGLVVKNSASLTTLLGKINLVIG